MLCHAAGGGGSGGGGGGGVRYVTICQTGIEDISQNTKLVL